MKKELNKYILGTLCVSMLCASMPVKFYAQEEYIFNESMQSESNSEKQVKDEEEIEEGDFDKEIEQNDQDQKEQQEEVQYENQEKEKQQIVEKNQEAQVLQVSANNEEDFTFVNGVITAYEGDESEVIIPAKIKGLNVTSIATGVFKDNETLERVVIPEGVVNIDSRTFENCKNLSSVELPESLRTIGNYAFYNCSSLEKIILPQKLTTLGNSIFSKCSNLREITIPDRVKTLSSSIFSQCTSLSKVNLPEGMKYIESSSFSDCTNLKEINLPSTVTQIGRSSFSNCASLLSIKVPNGVKRIDEYTFWGCISLEEISMAGDISIPYYGPFDNCISLEKVTLDYGEVSMKKIGYTQWKKVVDTMNGIKEEQILTGIVKNNTEVKYVKGDFESDNADLENIVLSSGRLSPEFNADTYEYTVQVENEVDIITIDAVLEDHKATLKGMGTKSLAVGNNVFKLSVTAENGITNKVYTIIVNRKERIVDEIKIRAFISRLYSTCLGRTADEGGLNYWTQILKEGSADGSGVADFFVNSEEFQSKGLSNKEYIQTMYRAFFDRIADEGGLNFWKSNLNQGLTKNYVLAGFVNSPEYEEICNTYGIKRGNIELTSILDQYPNITKFIYRMYTKCMSRTPDEDGLNYWVQGLVDGQFTGKSVAGFFVNSSEFENKNLLNEEYVEVMYEVFFGRTSDEDGKTYWLGELAKGTSRKAVFDGFVNSQEYKGICSGYGIKFE